jgi:hypothetical protein
MQEVHASVVPSTESFSVIKEESSRTVFRGRKTEKSEKKNLRNWRRKEKTMHNILVADGIKSGSGWVIPIVETPISNKIRNLPEISKSNRAVLTFTLTEVKK